MSSRDRRLYLVWRYLVLFSLNALVISSSFYLMFHFINVNPNEAAHGAPLVFGNILFLSALGCLFEWALRRLTTDRAVRRIRRAAERMAAGDLSERIDLSRLPAAVGDYAQIARDMNRMAEELSATETLRTDFVSNVSHELKTPLAVIKNYASLLKTPGLTEEKRQEYVDGIGRAADRTAALMTNILRLNKLENQKTVLPRETYDLGSQIAECMIDYEDLWEKKGIEVEADLAEDLFITADPELMTIVWNNLVSNAIKFTDPGGTVTVTARQQAEWIEVSVRDTGCGMDEQTGRHIFEKFYQGDSSHATEGNGLGLAMVKRIVDMTGGEIRVESRLGEGSTFTVRFRNSDSKSTEANV